MKAREVPVVGGVYDVRGQNAIVTEDWVVSHTIRVVYIDDELRYILYKRADMPLRWRKRNPLRVVAWWEILWLLEAGYWERMKYRPLGYIEQAEIREQILDRSLFIPESELW